MGRPRIPDEMKAARGTLKPCRAQRDIGSAMLLTECKPPRVLKGAAKKYFAATADTLINWGLMTAADINAITIYAQAMAEWEECVRDIAVNGRFTVVTDKKGRQSVVANPHIMLRDQNAATVLRISKEYGLTAMSRKQLASAMAPAKQEDEFAEYDEL